MTVSRKKHKKKIPFGSKVDRFSSLGYHPKLETRSGTYKYPNIFPGCHDWNKAPKIVSKITSWERTLEIEEYSRRLAYHGDHIVKQRKWEKSINGPCWHNIPPVSPGREIIFLKNVRFPKPKLFVVPGPGTYGKNHVPFTLKEEKSKNKGFSFSMLMPFDGMARRHPNPQPSHHLPPNIYNIKTSIEELTSKRISKRGPYDLFTGPRFQRSTVPKQVDRKDLIHSRIDPNDWNHPKNNFKGKFMKCGKENTVTTRLILKDFTINSLTTPGPSDYKVYTPKIVSPSKFPFNCSVSEIRPVIKKTLLPPPGRYNFDKKKHIRGNGCKSAFLSKTKRGMPIAPKWTWFEN